MLEEDEDRQTQEAQASSGGLLVTSSRNNGEGHIELPPLAEFLSDFRGGWGHRV